MLAGAHKKFYCIQHLEIYLLDLKVQFYHKIKLPLDMVSKHVFLYLCLPDYQACCNLSFADLLQLVETSYNKPVEIINLQQIC